MELKYFIEQLMIHSGGSDDLGRACRLDSVLDTLKKAGCDIDKLVLIKSIHSDIPSSKISVEGVDKDIIIVSEWFD